MSDLFTVVYTSLAFVAVAMLAAIMRAIYEVAAALGDIRRQLEHLR